MTPNFSSLEEQAFTISQFPWVRNQSPSWGCSEDIGRGHIHLKAGGFTSRMTHSHGFYRNISYSACGPPHITVWVSLHHGGWLPPKVSSPGKRKTKGKLQCFYNPVSKVAHHHLYLILPVRSESLSPVPRQRRIRLYLSNEAVAICGCF